MNFAAYAQIWRVQAVRQTVIYGVLGKAPWFGVGMILTLHVVQTLAMPYSAAGLVSAVFTVAFAVASPWRGRMLDRLGLRRTLLPSMVVLPVVFAIAPFLPYWALVVAVAIAGLFAVPWFGLTRQAMIAAVPVDQRRTGLALDSIATEIAFMTGPALGILAATYGDTRWALLGFALASTLAALALWKADLALGREDEEGLEHARGRFGWVTGPVIGVFVATAAAIFVLAGQELTIIAAYRQMDADAVLAIAMIAWPLGSLVGGLIYGALPHRHPPLVWLVGGLAITTFPAVWADGPWMLLPFLVLTGLFCAPALAAGAELISHLVPPSRRGEALGWQGTVSTAGNALAPPVIGFAIDQGGWASGFWWTAVLGTAATVATALLISVGRRRRTVAASDAASLATVAAAESSAGAPERSGGDVTAAPSRDAGSEDHPV